MLTQPFGPPPTDEETINNSSNAGMNSAAEQGRETPMKWKPTPKEPVPVVRCHATANTTGERCKRWSIRGTTVCKKHGGQLENVQEHASAVVESARLQLMNMADEAVDVLGELMKPGVADAIRIKAVENVLNRSGIRDGVDLNVNVNDNRSAAEEISKKLATMRERMLPKAEPEEELIDEGEANASEEVPEEGLRDSGPES